MPNLPVYNTKGEEVERVELDKAIWEVEPNRDVLHQAIGGYLSNQRRGCASTKTRKEVRGGGRKPWKQKGTGRARAGSIRSPIWKGGGVTFGPHPRSFKVHPPKKMRRLALFSALSDKLRINSIIILDKLTLSSPKTKEILQILENLKIEGGALFVLERKDDFVERSVHNIPGIKVSTVNQLNPYDLLLYDQLILSRAALSEVEKKYSPIEHSENTDQIRRSDTQHLTLKGGE